jgi:DICT domain-containing protein
MKSTMPQISFLCAIFLLASCTVYTEKQSEALSRAVYATKDSLDTARIDTAITYSTEAGRIVKPPKHRIPIESVYQKIVTTIPVTTSSAKPKTPIPINKQRVLIIPEQYKNDTAIVVNSEEYQQLLKDKQIFEQLKSDLKNEQKFKKEVDEELQRQKEYAEKMVKDLNIMQKKLVEKDLAILKRNIVIVILLALGAAGIYLRMKGIL